MELIEKKSWRVLSWIGKHNRDIIQKNEETGSQVSIDSDTSHMTALSAATTQVMIEALRSASQPDISEFKWSNVAHRIINPWLNWARNAIRNSQLNWVREVIWVGLIFIITELLIPEDLFNNLT